MPERSEKAHRQVDRLLGLVVQRPHQVDGRFAHGQPALDHVAQFEQPHAEAVGARFHAVDETRHDHVVQDAVRRRRVQARHLRQLFQAHGVGITGQYVEQRHHALDHLDGRLRRFRGFHFHDVVGAVRYISLLYTIM